MFSQVKQIIQISSNSRGTDEDAVPLNKTCTLYTVQCTLYNVYCTMYTGRAQCTCIMYTVKYVICILANEILVSFGIWDTL